MMKFAYLQVIRQASRNEVGKDIGLGILSLRRVRRGVHAKRIGLTGQQASEVKDRFPWRPT